MKMPLESTAKKFTNVLLDLFFQMCIDCNTFTKKGKLQYIITPVYNNIEQISSFNSVTAIHGVLQS